MRNVRDGGSGACPAAEAYHRGMTTHGSTTDSAQEQQSPLAPLTLLGSADPSAGLCVDGYCVLPGAKREEDAD